MDRPAYGLCLHVKYARCRDGDTVVVSLVGSEREWAIRLIDTWCPELSEPGGKEAKVFAEQILTQCEDLAVYIPAPHDIHNLLANITFDRIPGHLFVSETKTLNVMLIEAGHATPHKPKKV
jgi:endonuclease YncB( thermonuclease family)